MPLTQQDKQNRAYILHQLEYCLNETEGIGMAKFSPPIKSQKADWFMGESLATQMLFILNWLFTTKMNDYQQFLTKIIEPFALRK